MLPMSSVASFQYQFPMWFCRNIHPLLFTLYSLLITHLSSLFTFKFHLKLATGNIGIGNTTTLATLKRKLVLCSEHCAGRHELRKVFVDDAVSLLDRVVARKDVFRVIVPDFA